MTNERARARALCMNEYDRNIVSLLSKLFNNVELFECKSFLKARSYKIKYYFSVKNTCDLLNTVLVFFFLIFPVFGSLTSFSSATPSSSPDKTSSSSDLADEAPPPPSLCCLLKAESSPPIPPPPAPLWAKSGAAMLLESPPLSPCGTPKDTLRRKINFGSHVLQYPRCQESK